MSSLPPSLLALALALGLGLPSPSPAQQISTTKGMRTLPRIEVMKSEVEFRYAVSSSEGIVQEVLADIAVIEGSRQATVDQASALGAKVKQEAAELERAKAAFDQADQKYRSDLTAFQDKQLRVEAEIQRQRAEAATLQELPSAQRDHAQVERLNKWAEQLAAERAALEGDRNRLLADHASVEAERARVAQKRTEVEARLTGMREQTVGQYGGVEQKRAAAYAELRTATDFLKRARESLRGVTTIRLEDSPTLEQANAKLRAYDAGSKAPAR